MSRSSVPRVFVLLAVVAFVAMNALLFKQRLSAWITDLSGGILAPAAERLAALRAVVGTLFTRIDLARTNTELEDENTRLRSMLVEQEEQRRDLQFYRDAAGFEDKPATMPLEAGIFSYTRAGGVRQAVLNRGGDDWTIVGDVVATPRGELIGVVDRVYAEHSTIRVVGDVSFEVTARIASTDISGLVRPERDGSLLLDLIQNAESVSEGALVVTSGDDHFPAGLIIGKVSSVDNEAATLFKIVHIAASVPGSFTGHVVVLRQ